MTFLTISKLLLKGTLLIGRAFEVFKMLGYTTNLYRKQGLGLPILSPGSLRQSQSNVLWSG
jgi:hypothetical protein